MHADGDEGVLLRPEAKGQGMDTFLKTMKHKKNMENVFGRKTLQSKKNLKHKTRRTEKFENVFRYKTQKPVCYRVYTCFLILK